MIGKNDRKERAESFLLDHDLNLNKKDKGMKDKTNL